MVPPALVHWRIWSGWILNSLPDFTSTWSSKDSGASKYLWPSIASFSWEAAMLKQNSWFKERVAYLLIIFKVGNRKKQQKLCENSTSILSRKWICRIVEVQASKTNLLVDPQIQQLPAHPVLRIPNTFGIVQSVNAEIVETVQLDVGTLSCQRSFEAEVDNLKLHTCVSKHSKGIIAPKMQWSDLATFTKKTSLIFYSCKKYFHMKSNKKSQKSTPKQTVQPPQELILPHSPSSWQSALLQLCNGEDMIPTTFPVAGIPSVRPVVHLKAAADLRCGHCPHNDHFWQTESNPTSTSTSTTTTNLRYFKQYLLNRPLRTQLI